VPVNITVTSYAPKVFKVIREKDGVDEIDIMKSIKPNMNKL
jgi:hypothetical protein